MKDIVKEVEDRLITKLTKAMSSQDKDYVDMITFDILADVEELEEELNKSFATTRFIVDFLRERL